MGKIELGGEDEAEETMEIRGDTVKHKGKSNQTFHSKNIMLFFPYNSPFIEYRDEQ